MPQLPMPTMQHDDNPTPLRTWALVHKSGAARADGTRVALPTPPGEASGRRVRTTAVRLAILLVGMFVLPNAAIFGLHLLAQRGVSSPSPGIPIANFAQVDDGLWRGAAPSQAGYEALAAHGVTTVIDLRAEDDLDVDTDLLARLGLNRVQVPMRDGQAPNDEQVARFMSAVAASEGRVFVHCGAGVGRTGTMSAAYLVTTGQATPSETLRRNLSVGPPSLEQLAFSAGLGRDERARPTSLMVAISRTLDAPRRIWVNIRP